MRALCSREGLGGAKRGGDFAVIPAQAILGREGQGLDSRLRGNDVAAKFRSLAANNRTLARAG